MTHNCQTILQPPLVPVASCTLPDRDTYAEQRRIVASDREVIVLKLIAETPGISQTRISAKIGAAKSTTSKLLKSMVKSGKIDEVKSPSSLLAKRKHYRIKEFLQ